MFFKEIVAASVIGFSAFSFAEAPSYSYVELGYIMIDIDVAGIDLDLDGFGIAGSVELTEQFYLSVDYASLSDDPSGVDVDYDTFSINAGFIFYEGDATNAFFQVGYVDAEVEVASESADDSATAFALGVRSNVADNFELGAGVSYIDEDGADPSFNLEGQVFVTETVGLVGKLSVNDGDTGISIGVRGSF